jgi:hypothetical protein
VALCKSLAYTMPVQALMVQLVQQGIDLCVQARGPSYVHHSTTCCRMAACLRVFWDKLVVILLRPAFCGGGSACHVPRKGCPWQLLRPRNLKEASGEHLLLPGRRINSWRYLVVDDSFLDMDHACSLHSTVFCVVVDVLQPRGQR